MKNYTQIAMRCNKEQFQAIKPKLEKSGIILYMISEFTENFYLAIIFDGIVTNGTISNREGKVIHEQWNEKIFLEACVIETEPNYQIAKETILKYNMKDEFPDVFEVELEVGKWYKHASALDYLVICKGNNEAIGFVNGTWSNGLLFGNQRIECGCVEATYQEVETALKNEAVKRYKVGDYIFDGWSKIQANIERLDKFDFSYNTLFVLSNNNSKTALFCDGIWASVLETKTIQQAEELLKELGHNFKIV